MTDPITVPAQSPLRIWSLAQLAVNHGWSVQVSRVGGGLGTRRSWRLRCDCPAGFIEVEWPDAKPDLTTTPPRACWSLGGGQFRGIEMRDVPDALREPIMRWQT